MGSVVLFLRMLVVLQLNQYTVSFRVVIRNTSSIIFQLSLLYRRLWTYTVLAHGCDEHMVMDSTYLSKILITTVMRLHNHDAKSVNADSLCVSLLGFATITWSGHYMSIVLPR